MHVKLKHTHLYVNILIFVYHNSCREMTKPVITRLYELCVTRKWNRPRFECEVEVTSTGNSIVHSFTVKCFVEADEQVFSSQGKLSGDVRDRRLRYDVEG